MLFSLALIFIFSLVIGKIFKTISIPALAGMLLVGIALGPCYLNLLDPKLLGISAELRKIALIIILMRAGLALDIKDLKKVGRPAFLLCFLPAVLEISAMVIFAPKILGLSMLESLVLASVIAAVSPAVIVPKMLNLMETGYGTDKKIPQMIMAGASIDDVFVIVLFTVFTSLAVGGTFTAMSILQVPVSIILGIAIGLLMGYCLSIFFQKVQMRDSLKVIVVLSISFLLVKLEAVLQGKIGFSGLLAVMAMGLSLQKRKPEVAKGLSWKFSKLWIPAEILLFVLVGAELDVSYISIVGFSAVILLAAVLMFRMIGVYLCLLGTKLSKGERIFCMFAYTPKATVQAAIGAIPLSMGLACGNVVLSVAVISILITAPLGSFFIDLLQKRVLNKAKPAIDSE